MGKYNIQDVKLLEKVYVKLRPYAVQHPNMATIAGRPDCCPRCGSDAGFLAQGWRYTKTGKNRVFQCKGCGSKVTLRQGEKNIRPNYV